MSILSSELADLITNVFFHTSDISRDCLKIFKSAKVGWCEFTQEVVCFTFIAPVLFSFSVLFLPLSDPLGPGNISKYNHWTFLIYIFVFCLPMSVLPHALAASYLEKKDLYFSKFLFLSAGTFILLTLMALSIATNFIYPFPFSPILLIAPIWLGLNVAVFKTTLYIPTKYTNDPEHIKKANGCFMLSVMYLIGFCFLLLYNFVYYAIRNNDTALVILMMFYPILAYLIRFIVLALTRRISSDCALQSLYVFYLWPAVYFQFQFACTKSSLTLNVLLLALGVAEESFSLIFLSRYWRSIPELLRKRQHKAKLQGEVTPLPHVRSSQALPETLPVPVATPTTAEKLYSGNITGRLLTIAAPPTFNLDNRNDVRRINTFVCVKVNDGLNDDSQDESQKVPLRQANSVEQRSIQQEYPVSPAPKKAKSFSGPFFPLQEPQTNSQHKWLDIPTKQQQNSSDNDPLSPKGTPTTNLTQPKLRNKLFSEYIPTILPASPVSTHIQDDSLDYNTSAVVFEKCHRRYKVIPFELECYNWRTCNIISLSLITSIISPCIYILLFTIVFWVPYNSTSYYITQRGDVSQGDIEFSFYFAGYQFGLLIILLYFLVRIINLRYGIDIRTAIHVLVTQRRRFLLVVTSLIYGTSLFAQLVAMGIDLTFQFQWIQEKELETL